MTAARRRIPGPDTVHRVPVVELRPKPGCPVALAGRPRRVLRPSPTPIGDMMDHVLWGERLATWNARTRGHRRMDGTRYAGGEWDTLRNTPLRTRRRLQGAGWLRQGGLAPDELGDLVRSRLPGAGDWADCDCVAWYVRTALRAIRERRTAAHRDRHLAYARAQGATTYYALRDQQARDAGYRSLWDMRRQRGWV